MTIAVKHCSYLGWQAIILQSERVRLVLIPDLGGRILSLQYEDIELLFVDKAHAGETFEITPTTNLQAMKQSLGFRLWGGDKTWVAPQSSWWQAIPPLALDAGRYTISQSQDTFVLTSPICYETGLQIERRVCLHQDDHFTLQQTFINHSDAPIQRGIWNVTQILQPAECFLKAPLEAIHAFANEGDSVVLQDTRVQAIQEGWIRIDCTTPAHFKFGARVTQGIAKAVYHANNGKRIALTKFFAIDPHANYAHDTMVEIYNSPNYPYCELEIHAPCITLEPNATTTHEQRWELNGN